ncbi:hypothetical protein PAECIP111892_01789 [Paenibacillus auburnensis]|uniref:Uncharacterized protein n=1 Tax=Paenibacillus auburnensis TaxID=2905649 RepID=A0ABM9BUC3_9BACL|nr:hypothetical protein [Paenibacillus auburnensis]CAH1194659.1 hypothetical protein PAECIP111892_01789 [Paenibacillus auburnensis]
MTTFEVSFYRRPHLDRHFVVTHQSEQIAVPADFFFGILPDVDMFATTGFTSITTEQFEQFGFTVPTDRIKYFRAVDRSLYFVHLPRTKQNLAISRAALVKITGISGLADVGITPPLSASQLSDIGFIVPPVETEATVYEYAVSA